LRKALKRGYGMSNKKKKVKKKIKRYEDSRKFTCKYRKKTNNRKVCRKCTNKFSRDKCWDKVPNDLFIGMAVTILINFDFPERFKDGKDVEDIFISTVGRNNVLPEDEKSCLEELKRVVKNLYEMKM
jgi:hypothetical protein